MEDKITILRQKGNAALIRLDGKVELGGRVYRTLRFEIWNDMDKMRLGIPGEEKNGKRYIYCSGFSGSKEEDVIKVFELRYGY